MRGLIEEFGKIGKKLFSRLTESLDDIFVKDRRKIHKLRKNVSGFWRKSRISRTCSNSSNLPG
jgi:hypothetical protein